MSEPSNLTPMKLPSLLTTLSRHFKQRELNRTIENLAELSELLAYWSTKVNYATGGIPGVVAENVGHWRGKRAKLLVRRDRLEKELGFVKSGE